MPRLVLHAGLHKTGTSAIQAFASQHRETMRNRGIFYPDIRSTYMRKTDAHYHFAHAIANPKNKSLRRERFLVNKWKQIAESLELSVLLSAEAIWRHIDITATGDWIVQRRFYLEKLANLLSPFETSCVIILRRQDDYVRSLFQEYVKNKYGGLKQEAPFTIGFPQHLLSFGEFRDFAKKNFLRIRDNLLLFEDTFGQISVYLYNELKESGQLPIKFFNKLGINTAGMQNTGLVRKSPNVKDHLVKYLFTPAINTVAERNEILSWIASDEVQKILLDEVPAGQRFSLWESPEVRINFMENFNEENEALRQRFFPDRKFLFDPIEDEDLHRNSLALSELGKQRLVLAAYKSALITGRQAEALGVKNLNVPIMLVFSRRLRRSSCLFLKKFRHRGQ
jgi:hypothetical protein